MLSYCDFIAATISDTLRTPAASTLLRATSRPLLDLHPKEGYFVSTRKFVSVEDKWGKFYRITIEEV